MNLFLWSHALADDNLPSRIVKTHGREYLYICIYIGNVVKPSHREKRGRAGVLRMVEKMQVTGNRLPGKPKKRLEQLVQGDMKK